MAQVSSGPTFTRRTSVRVIILILVHSWLLRMIELHDTPPFSEEMLSEYGDMIAPHPFSNWETERFHPEASA
jgi:hypothetical protein